MSGSLNVLSFSENSLIGWLREPLSALVKTDGRSKAYNPIFKCLSLGMQFPVYKKCLIGNNK